MDGTWAPVSLMSEPPKKLPKPTPKVVMARPVTFWLARSVTVRKQYRRPMRSEPIRQHTTGMSRPSAALICAPFRLRSYKNEPMTPQMAPTYMTPGMPRLRLPDFSVIISPVLP